MAISKLKLFCLITFAIVCLVSSSAASECYHCIDGSPTPNPLFPSCSNVHSPLYKKRCSNFRTCVNAVYHMKLDGESHEYTMRSCLEEITHLSRAEMEVLSMKDACSNVDFGEIGKVSICVCQNNLCNSATSQQLNNLMKIMFTLILLINLHRVF